MKVLFAVNNENISESIIKSYQQTYKEIISAKNVYYFNAIIKELQRDKTYDRIIISEDLEPFANQHYEAIDKFIFEKMDSISDEATNSNGNDIPIILICTDRRTKSEPLLVKLFGIGVYSALLGKDRTIPNVCDLLNKPRTKKEAKIYYHIDSEDVDYKTESEGNVSEVEIQNILTHYKRLGRNEEKYVESFDRISEQYTDEQLKLIIKFLPINVKAVLEANSEKYQQLMTFGTTTSKKASKTVEKHMEQPSKAKKQPKQPIKQEPVNLDFIEQNLNRNQMNHPVIIPSSIDTTKARIEETEPVKTQPILEPKVQEEPEVVSTPKRRGRPKKVKTAEELEKEQIPAEPKRRGRPRKVQPEEQQKEQEPVNLFALEEEETSSSPLTSNQNNLILPGLEEDEEETFVATTKQEDLVLPGLEEEPEITSNTFSQVPVNRVQEPTRINPIQASQTYDVESVQVPGSSIESLLTKDKKMVAFVGTSKNGTSFLVNNLAEMLSQKGIKTAILDLTTNKNSYYIYTENEEELRTKAYQSFENLRKGIPDGIQVNKNLTVYTSLPGEDEALEDYQNILATLVKNYSLILFDCDFNTNYAYFKEVQELYLVQSMDVLTIQPLTAFLRDLKAKNVLSPEKIRVVLNKMLKVRSVSEKTIIGGMAFYNDPAMSFMTELFNKDTVAYTTIPFEEQTYSKYLEGLINCKITLNGYSKNLLVALEKLGNMVYPLITNQNNKKNSYAYQPASSNAFTSNMNATLNKMKNSY